MKIKLAFILLGIILLQSCYPEVSPALKDAAQFQKELYSYYYNETTTPLKADDKENFKGIHFFDLDEAYIVEATFIPSISGEPIAFPTSAQQVKYFKEYGTLNFSVKGNAGTLTLYQSHPISDPTKEGTLFLPFKDATSGLTSYGAGRYMDLSPKDIINNRIIIDFNKAYNPYCAYSVHYNCPLTPSNNILNFPIEAGVKYP